MSTQSRKSGVLLSHPQRAVLVAAKLGELMWVRPVISGGGYMLLPNETRWKHTMVRRATVEALIRRGLLEAPSGLRGPGNEIVQVTDAGRQA